MRFAEVIGQQEIKTRLIRSVREGRIPHAQLFLGQEGSGNLALALAYAQYVNCTQRSEEDSCGQCPSCIKIAKLSHPDVHFAYPLAGSDEAAEKHMEAFRQAVMTNPYFTFQEWMAEISDEKNGTITVKQSNEIMRRLTLKPYEGLYQFMIIWMPEKMNVQAGNKLLKTIEEPPDRTAILLVANHDDKILTTILSRTQLVKLKKISDFDMLDGLVNQFGIELEKGREIVNIADGNFNMAKKLAEYEDFKDSNFPQFVAWMRACFKLDIKELAKLADQMQAASREKQKAFYDYSLHIIREALAQRVDPVLLRVTEEEKNFLQKFSAVIHTGNAPAIAEKLEKAIYYVDRNAHAKILFMNLSLDVAGLVKAKIE